MSDTAAAGKPSRRAIAMGALGIVLILCTAVAMIAIINDRMPLALVCGILAVVSHLSLWRLLNQAHRDQEQQPAEPAESD